MMNKKYFTRFTCLSLLVAVALVSGGSRLVAEEQEDVTITANVEESITFSVSDENVEFGTLTGNNERYATTDGGSDTETTAHTFTVGTNAEGGYTVAVQGSSLSLDEGDHVIDAIATEPAASSPGTEQFGLAVIDDDEGGSGSVAANYDHSGDEYFFEDDSTVASSDGVSDDHTFDVAYLANIESLTPAGNYSTTLNYIATAQF